MFKGEKTTVFWLGLIILGLASVALFFQIRFYGPFVFGPSIDFQVPIIVGAIVFILIGLYMMKSCVKKGKRILVN
jgi:hypothetical protein